MAAKLERAVRRHPWDQVLRETAKAFAAFIIYREMAAHRRSIVEVSREQGKHVKLIERWATRYGWLDRARAYDKFIDREQQKGAAEGARAMGRRHAENARKIIAIGMREVNKMELLSIKRQKELPKTPGDLLVALHTAVELVERGMKEERLATGMPTDIQEYHESRRVDVTKLNVSELKAAKALVAKAVVVDTEGE